MSTNPFDDDSFGGPPSSNSASAPPLPRIPPSSSSSSSSRMLPHQSHPSHRSSRGASSSHQHQQQNQYAQTAQNSNTQQQNQKHQQHHQNQQQNQPPIWAARGVEWPLPSALNSPSYRKWRRESKSLGVTMGIMGSGLKLDTSPGGGLHSTQEGGGAGGSTGRNNNVNTHGHGHGGGGGGGDYAGGGGSVRSGNGARKSGLGGARDRQQQSAFLRSSDNNNNDSSNNNRADHSGGDASIDGGMTHYSSGSGGGATVSTATTGGYGGLTGLMGRVLGASSQSASAGGASLLLNDVEEEDLSISATRPILPPRTRCVAASNGWIVAAVECSHPPSIIASSFPPSSSSVAASTISSSSVGGGVGGNPMLSKHHGLSLTTLIPPLRLISRWNVRRGTSLGSEGNHLIPLPPPVRPTTGGASSSFATEDSSTLSMKQHHYASSFSTSSSSHPGNDPNFGRILHTFVDPTGCHVLLSARNGEAYYLHSTSKKVRKLAGFGPSADGSYSGFVPGVSLGDSANVISVGSIGSGEAVVQTGLTPGSYVTAVGWDRDRGTEGSTKRILLGTSFGELYEYALVSPNASSSAPTSTSTFSVNLRGGTSDSLMGKGAKSSAFDTKAGELGALDDGDEPIESPVLLRRLNANTSGGRNSSGSDVGGAVGGILFQRIIGRSPTGKEGSIALSGGSVMVLVSTGGLHRHTRLHTFRSEPSKGSASLSLRSAFSRQAEGAGRGSFVELPGSVEFADLRSCNDGFALRTETGIYYGTMERTVLSASMGADAGMLPYDIAQDNSRRDNVLVPASIGLTPHHFITLTSMNEVRFINRVARKVIQQERVDWMSLSQSSSTDDSYAGGGAPELLMDIRRPDQIWLRKGRSLVHISSSCEDRDVWKFTLMKCVNTAPHRDTAGGGLSLSSRHLVSSTVPLTNEEKCIDSQFEHAKSLCSNASQKAVVNSVRAEYHLSHGRVELAAKYMAQCPSALMPFADTAVRLALPMLGSDAPQCRNNSAKASEALANSNMALIAYLSDKMKVAKAKNDSMVCTMLGAWLTELHLHERERDGSGKPVYLRQNHRHLQPANHALLHQFLSSYVRDMDSTTVIKVLEAHDISAGECAGYSAAAGDIGAAINAALCGEDGTNGALDALRILNDSPIEKAEPHYYKQALTLLSRAPMPAAKSFLARNLEGLSETKLLPAFMHYERKRAENKKTILAEKVNAKRAAQKITANSKGSDRNAEKLKIPQFEIDKSRTFGYDGVEIRIDQAESALPGLLVDDENASVKYFEGVIKLGSKNRAIYNYLTLLYANMDDEGPLFRFLSAHIPQTSVPSRSSTSVRELVLKQARDESSSPLDKSYALRTILRTGRHFRSAVKLYMGFGMRQQAVELALKVDPSLARELARQSSDKDERKRLWLMIARNAAANGTSRDGKDVVARVVLVLKDCGPDVLSIEDVLPFLPDFAQIDQFKDEICEALASYSSKIEHHLKEMTECDQACDALREELSRLQTVSTHVRADARCAFTNKYILEDGGPFYVFPSGYVVLERALKQEVVPHLNEKQHTRIKFMEQELARLRNLRANGNRTSYELAKYDYEAEELQNELDGLIAAECPLTGSIMVDSIDCGFLGDDDNDY